MALQLIPCRSGGTWLATFLHPILDSVGGAFGKTELQTRTARTDSPCRSALCGVPRGMTLRARSASGADSMGEIVVDVPADGDALQDFLLAKMRNRCAMRSCGCWRPAPWH